MPRLIDLFENEQLQRGPYAGQTAQDAFYPKNANKIPLSSNSPVINATTMKLVNRLRSSNGSTLDESVLEQEITGIRVLGTLSQPLLYGAEMGRMVLRETQPLSEMKLDTSGALPSGPIGKAFKSIRTFATKTLGIPTLATPTFAKNFSDPTKGSLETTNNIQKDYQKVLTDIKDSSNGSLFGRLLKGGLGSLTDPDQLKSKVIGEAMKFGKGLLRDTLVGGGNAPSQNNYDFDKFPAFANGVKIVRNYGRNTQNNSSFTSFNPTGITTLTQSLPNFVKNNGNYFDAGGSTYSSFFKPTITTIESKNISILGSEDNILAPPGKFTLKSDDAEENREFGLLKNSPFPNIELNKKINRAGKLPKKQIKKRKQNLDNYSETKYNESSFGIKTNTIGPYGIIDDDDSTYDKYDTISLKFESVAQRSAVNFLATISGLTESFSPSWNPNKFIGNPFNFYTYDGIERNVSFSFKIFSLNPSEHKVAWSKLDFLTSLVYPQGYGGDSGYITAPFLRLTLGDMYKRKDGFLDSLSYSIDDNTPWEIEDSSPSLNDDVSTKSYKLPRIINVDVSFKFIEQRFSVEGNLYPFSLQSQVRNQPNSNTSTVGTQIT